MLLLFSVVAYIALVALALLSDRIIFRPHPSSYRLSDLAASSSVQPLILTSGQVNISAVYLPNVSARYTLLFSHGNAEDLGDDLPMLNELRRAGFALFAYDYRGYGTSQGVSSEKSLYEDVDAAYEYVTRTLHVSRDRIISFGRSLGCAAAIHLAATRSVAGLIVEAPFLSTFACSPTCACCPGRNLTTPPISAACTVPYLSFMAGPTGSCHGGTASGFTS